MKNCRGAGLPLALLSVLVMALLGATVYSLTRALAKESVYLKRTSQAQFIAEAGLEDAMLQLRLTPTWRTGFTNKPFAGGSYTVTVSTHDNPWVVSTGYSSSIAALKGPARRSVTAQVALRIGLPAFAENSFTIAGLINSYDSLIDPAPAGFTAEAPVWSNGTVTMVPPTGGPRVQGDLTYFTPPAPDASTVSGSITLTESTMTATAVDGSAFSCSTCNNNDTLDNAFYNQTTMTVLVSTGDTMYISGGGSAQGRNFYLKGMEVYGKIKIGNDKGPVTIYLAGNLYVSSAGSIEPKDTKKDKFKIPKRFVIYGQGGRWINLNASKPMYGVIHAPLDDVRLNQVIYGKIVGKTVNITANGVEHFDLSLYSMEETAKAGWIEGTWSLGY